VLRRYYSNSFISEEDIEADVEEELEAGWWDSFNLEFEEHSDADDRDQPRRSTTL
jgi:hypothetical protein